MGMTMTQKILAAHAGLESVKPGDLIMADLDLVLGNDITSPVAINVFKNINKETVFDKDKVALVPVSYTHLDVYKRQPIISEEMVLFPLPDSPTMDTNFPFGMLRETSSRTGRSTS